ncbi:MAG: hypothetical protein ACMUIL_06990 [bacterium]
MKLNALRRLSRLIDGDNRIPSPFVRQRKGLASPARGTLSPRYSPASLSGTILLCKNQNEI